MASQKEKLPGKVELVRKSFLLQYLAICASTIQFPERKVEWMGTLRRGSFFLGNGSGDLFHAGWEGERLVIRLFDHESSRSSPPSAIPPTYAELVKDAKENVKGATSEMWQEGKSFWIGEPYATSEENGLWLLERHFMNPIEAMTGKGENWRAEYSISEEQTRAVLLLAARGGNGTVHVTQDELDLIGTVGASLEQFPPTGVEKSREQFAAAGFIWPPN